MIIRQIKTTLYTFEEQNQIKDTIDIHQFIDPSSKRVEDPIDDVNLVNDLTTNYLVTLEEVPDIDPDPVVPIRPAQALASIQTLKEWEEQQDDSTHDVVRQLQALEKRVKCLQGRGLQQWTLASYFT
jgi:hypothetical protein